MRPQKLLAAAFVATTLFACTDGPVSVGPDAGRIVLTPSFSFNGASSGLPIEILRLTPMLASGEALGTAIEDTVSPTARSWTVRLPIDLGERDSATILVDVEMLSIASGSRIVEWSGRIGPLLVFADQANDLRDPVELGRGPLENRDVDSLLISGPGYMVQGQTHVLYAMVRSTGAAPTVLWTSSDTSVATVDPMGDSVQVRAVGGGYTSIVAAAGSHADTLTIFVDDSEAGPIAAVSVFPDSALLTLGSSRAWQAYATDSAEVPVAATFVWESLDPAIATVTQSGVVTAVAIGRARVIASAGGFADTAIVNVVALPEGVDLVWQGGTPGAEDDWFTPENWSPAEVPTAASVIYLAQSSWGIVLDADAEVGAILSDSLGAWIDLGASTLTVHGDVLLGYYGWIYADAGGRLVIDAPTARLSGSLPATTLLGAVATADYTSFDGGIVIDGSARTASLDIGLDHTVSVYGSASLTNARLGLTQDSSTFAASYLYIDNDLTIDGGDSRGALTGGQIYVGGDFIVTGTTCSAFVSTGTAVQLAADTSRISIGCSSATGNRFHDLYVYGAGASDRLLYLDSDVYVDNELYISGGVATRLIGSGVTVSAAVGYLYATTLESVFLELGRGLPVGSSYLDQVAFTGMTGETRPQIRYSHPGEPCQCYYYLDVAFDGSSSGPYIEAVDTNADADSLTLYMARNPGDGAARTVTSGAVVHWAGIPWALLHWSGSGQSGTANQPLTDSLRAYVVDYGYYPVAGVRVDWAVAEGNGAVSPLTVTTDSAGIAATQFTLGDATFQYHSVMATSPALPADTVLFYGYPSGSPAGIAGASNDAAASPEVEVRRRPARAPRLEASTARAADDVRRLVVPPERPARVRTHVTEGGRP